MTIYEIVGTTPAEPGMKALGVRYQWSFRNAKWVNMTLGSNDGTGMSVDNEQETEAHLSQAEADGEWLEDIHIEKFEWQEES